MRDVRLDVPHIWYVRVPGNRVVFDYEVKRMGAGENIRVFLDTEDFYHENSKLSQAILKTQADTVLYGKDDFPEIPEEGSVEKADRNCKIRITKHRSYSEP